MDKGNLWWVWTLNKGISTCLGDKNNCSTKLVPYNSTNLMYPSLPDTILLSLSGFGHVFELVLTMCLSYWLSQVLAMYLSHNPLKILVIYSSCRLSQALTMCSSQRLSQTLFTYSSHSPHTNSGHMFELIAINSLSHVFEL